MQLQLHQEYSQGKKYSSKKNSIQLEKAAMAYAKLWLRRNDSTVRLGYWYKAVNINSEKWKKLRTQRYQPNPATGRWPRLSMVPPPKTIPRNKACRDICKEEKMYCQTKKLVEPLQMDEKPEIFHSIWSLAWNSIWWDSELKQNIGLRSQIHGLGVKFEYKTEGLKLAKFSFIDSESRQPVLWMASKFSTANLLQQLARKKKKNYITYLSIYLTLLSLPKSINSLELRTVILWRDAYMFVGDHQCALDTCGYIQNHMTCYLWIIFETCGKPYRLLYIFHANTYRCEFTH